MICLSKFQLLYQERNIGVEYEYSVMNGTVISTDPDGYRWLYDEFSNCSATCGGGTVLD